MRGRKRSLLGFAVFATLFYYYCLPFTSWSSSGGGQGGELESARLERLMNSDAEKTSSLRSNSSFDWSKVRFKYLPGGQLRRPPTGRPVSLPQVQHPFPPESPAATKIRNARRQQVRDLFCKNWKSYRKYAWRKDALQPLSAEYKDQFSGWAATLVDSLDTLWIMGLRAEFDEAVAAVADIDFGTSSSVSVNMFEVNIRYLGGLLAAFDLSGRDLLLRKAVELGDLLYAGYNTKDRMPVDFISFEAAKTGEGLMVEGSVVSASPGTLSLEMTHLSQVTGDPKYYDAVSRLMDVFEKGQAWTKIPGLWPIYVSMQTQDVVNGSYFSIGGGADSLYEYLPKMYALLGGLEPRYGAMSKDFIDAANRTFFFRPMLPAEEDVLMIGPARVEDDGTVLLDPESEHLGCFVGGIYGLAGRLFRRRDWVDDLGSKLTHGCIYAYRAMPTGIMPERYNMAACRSRGRCPWDSARFDAEAAKQQGLWSSHLPLGFTTARDPRYLLRPEAIESVFVMYRITGRREFQDAAWDMFASVSKGTATKYANAAVLDVTRAEYPLPQEDYMESFWLAETLKYFYLVFSPPDLISLDDYVLNTEAHPFRRPKGLKRSRPL
ncbi:family 47 glycosyl hydrolase [Lasiosphaeria miniovina]|uniref:alpha-1,2-Mannosidase n=1 Tax=Lasiosphaeria miniovina TaxID=1954250 RepID=A0AA40DRI9_9PEZI|nr:family 47 glycosyl hydrolase [Lasiosphaeria miniovina]KAK0712925.1 family 47 glycosyl hydrolase [Lasiosphaeria miniovina]